MRASRASVSSRCHLAFVACENKANLLTVDLDTKAVTSTLIVGDDPDVLAFDPSLRRLYLASGSGTVTIVNERDRTANKTAETKLADTAHTVAVDPAPHRVYRAREHRRPPHAARHGDRVSRRDPGTQLLRCSGSRRARSAR